MKLTCVNSEHLTLGGLPDVIRHELDVRLNPWLRSSILEILRDGRTLGGFHNPIGYIHWYVLRTYLRDTFQ